MNQDFADYRFDRSRLTQGEQMTKIGRFKEDISNGDLE